MGKVCSCSKRKHATHEEIILRAILKDPDRLRMIRDRCWNNSQRNNRVGRGSLSRLLDTLAELILEVRASDLMKGTSVETLFARFDTNSNGTLSKSECGLLIEAILQNRCYVLSAEAALYVPWKQLTDHYTLGKKLGSGGQGAMHLATFKSTCEPRCVKFYRKGDVNAPFADIKTEFQYMKSFNSPYVARTYEIFQDWSYVYIVSEPYYGNDLNSLLSNARKAGVNMDASWIRGIFSQLLKGLVYIHNFGLIHCDIKEANVMIAGDSDWNYPHVVIIDFGLSARFVSSDTGLCGTPGYIPPEVFKTGVWVQKGDVFSAGMVFFSLLGGTNPLIPDDCSGQHTFFGEVKRRTCSKQDVCLRNIRFPSSQLKELLRKMLQKQLRARPTAAECLKDSWFNGRTNEEDLPEGFVEQLKHLKRQTEVQEAALEHLLSNKNLAQMRGLNDLFRRFDADGDGNISTEEARNVLRKIGELSDSNIDTILQALRGHDGKVEYLHFMSQMMGRELLHEERRLRELFDTLDADRNGYLSQDELPSLVKACRYDSDLSEKLLKELDSDGDGKISFQEFQKHCLGLISALSTDEVPAKRRKLD